MARKSAIVNGLMGGTFLGVMMGFSCFSWAMGFVFIKYGIENPRTGLETSVPDIFMTY